MSIRTDLLMSLAALVGCNNPDKTDLDGDGFVTQDCDDADAAINPDAEEICDAVDNNCNDEVDADCDGNIDNDEDLDGYSDAACGGQDCHDADASNFDECTPGLDPISPGVDCLDILTVEPTAPSGT
ncbi:MAG: hypothetical protein ACI9VR_004594 [Cognaticolwellia sp.]|jgi:hypothetical protein